MNNNLYPWQHTLWQHFCQQQQQQRLAHAILLSGMTGLGKREFANALVANVLCKALTTEQTPCGHCHSCQLLAAGHHPDHLEIMPEEAGKQIKIDQIRQLKEKQQLTPSVATWKTVIISPANSMNISASNSLLKLLEEPQANTLLILITEQIEHLSITLRSRCQHYHLTPPPKQQALAWLTEQKTMNNTEAEQALVFAHGAPLSALALINENRAEQYQQIERDFTRILTEQVNPIALAESWQVFELRQLLHYLYYLVNQHLIVLINNKPFNSQQSTENKQYLKIADCIISTIKLISTSNNINKALLTENFIVSVSKVMRSSDS